jgi:hypothetical protein
MQLQLKVDRHWHKHHLPALLDGGGGGGQSANSLLMDKLKR